MFEIYSIDYYYLMYEDSPDSFFQTDLEIEYKNSYSYFAQKNE